MSCATENTYALGSTVVCEIEYHDPVTDALVDPSTPKASIKDPNGTKTTYIYGTDVEMVKDAVGQYHVNVNANLPGTWYYRGWSIGSYKGSKEESFEVDASQFE